MWTAVRTPACTGRSSNSWAVYAGRSGGWNCPRRSGKSPAVRRNDSALPGAAASVRGASRIWWSSTPKPWAAPRHTIGRNSLPAGSTMYSPREGSPCARGRSLSGAQPQHPGFVAGGLLREGFAEHAEIGFRPEVPYLPGLGNCDIGPLHLELLRTGAAIEQAKRKLTGG